MNFWGKDRTYHHTPPISLMFAMREALRILFEEGLEAGWRRHRQNQLALIAGIEALGLDPFVPDPDDRLPTVTSVRIPAAPNDAAVRRQLLNEFGIEIAGGIGELKGKIWRVGLMGHTSQEKYVLLFLAALEKVLLDQDFSRLAGRRRGRSRTHLRARGARRRRATQMTDPKNAIADSSAPATIPNRGPMSDFVAPFDVPSKLTDEAYHVRFSHLWNGIATRHSDTIDTKFFVDGRASSWVWRIPASRSSAGSADAISPIARPASSPPNTSASGSNRKMNARFTMYPARTSCAWPTFAASTNLYRLDLSALDPQALARHSASGSRCRFVPAALD